MQKAEAQRLCLEVLGWVTEDRAGARAFNVSMWLLIIDT